MKNAAIWSIVVIMIPCPSPARCGVAGFHEPNSPAAMRCQQQQTVDKAPVSAVSTTIRLSKRLSHLLRHDPGQYGIELSPTGWASVEKVCDALGIDEDQLDSLVASGDKVRHVRVGSLIRATHGHSVPVEQEIEPSTPPEYLFHGTTDEAWSQIEQEGLLPMKRAYVHLSATPEVAAEVGARRHGQVLLRIKAAELAEDGMSFYQSASGIWLTDAVPAEYLATDPNG